MGLIVLLLVPIFCKQKLLCRKKKKIDDNDLIKSDDENIRKNIDDNDLIKSSDENNRNTFSFQPNISNAESNKKFIIHHSQLD
jgi:hypothetical protein